MKPDKNPTNIFGDLTLKICPKKHKNYVTFKILKFSKKKSYKQKIF